MTSDSTPRSDLRLAERFGDSIGQFIPPNHIPSLGDFDRALSSAARLDHDMIIHGTESVSAERERAAAWVICTFAEEAGFPDDVVTLLGRIPHRLGFDHGYEKIVEIDKAVRDRNLILAIDELTVPDGRARRMNHTDARRWLLGALPRVDAFSDIDDTYLKNIRQRLRRQKKSPGDALAARSLDTARMMLRQADTLGPRWTTADRRQRASILVSSMLQSVPDLGRPAAKTSLSIGDAFDACIASNATVLDDGRAPSISAIGDALSDLARYAWWTVENPRSDPTRWREIAAVGLLIGVADRAEFSDLSINILIHMFKRLVWLHAPAERAADLKRERNCWLLVLMDVLTGEGWASDRWPINEAATWIERHSPSTPRFYVQDGFVKRLRKRAREGSTDGDRRARDHAHRLIEQIAAIDELKHLPRTQLAERIMSTIRLLFAPD